MDLPPYSVDEYDPDIIISIIRYGTGWDNRGEISKKKQLQYLFRYLKDPQIDAKTTVFESEYIERHYLEDYAEYYVRCFNQHPRRCSRIHFFSNQFTEDQFTSVLQNESNVFRKLLSENYLGYIVIRPIPNTFLAKTCIKPYRTLAATESATVYKVITKPNPVSLFGIPLTAEAIAIQEQDKVVAACATSALWVYLAASKHLSDNHLPSLSAITKSAIPDDSDGSRTFPNKGLNPEQISKSLKCFKLEPTVYRYKDQGIACLDEITRNIYAYMGNEIPVLIGGAIYKKNKEGNAIQVGEHIICILGYKIEKDYVSNRDGLKLKSNSMCKLYAHDDRYGPYTKVNLDTENWPNQSKKTDAPDIEGLLLTQHSNDNDDELFVPDLLIIGLYHKIRITYNEIGTICNTFYKVVYTIIKTELPTLVGNNTITQDNVNTLLNSYNPILEGVWDISLITNNTLKEDIISSHEWCSSNGKDDKSDFLTEPLPRFIWRCQITHNGEKITDILFDATEVPQGKLVLGYISYSNRIEVFWHKIRESIKCGGWEHYRNSGHFSEDDKAAINSIIRFFVVGQEDIGLNAYYGRARLPKRSLKSGEADDFDNIQRRQDLFYIRGESHSNLSDLNLKTGTKYIWVINKDGDLVIGEDIIGNGKCLGHPTLIDGEPARIGGELFFKDATWSINAKSATYSSHLGGKPEVVKKYLDAVKNNKLPNDNINIDLPK